METINDFIEQVRQKYVADEQKELADNRLAGLLGISRQAIGQLKSGRTKHVSEKTAYQISALLGLNPAYVLLCLAVERAKNGRVRRVWQELVKSVPRAAAIILVAVFLFSAGLPETTYAAGFLTDRSVYYVKSTIKKFSSWMSDILLACQVIRFTMCYGI